jgi:SAM-dependent methyltransferase
MLGAATQLIPSQFIGGIYDSVTAEKAAPLIASLLTGRLPLANGSFLVAERWSESPAITQSIDTLPCAWRFVPGTGWRTPHLSPNDAKVLRLWRENIHRPAIAQLFGGERVPRAALDVIEGGSTLDLLLRSGVAELSGAHVTSELRWTTHDGLHVLSDPDVPDSVQGPAYLDPLWEAPVLSRLIPGPPLNSALDVGCGAGLITLRLASLATEVTAIDINPRALAVSRMNCAINDVGNVRFVLSDLFERIAGDQFDAVVFSSPTDREGEMGRSLLLAGESILDRFLQQLPQVLSSQGWCLINLAVNEATFGKVIDRAAVAFNSGTMQRDIAFVQTSRAQWDKTWSRGLLLVAPGQGCQKTCVLDYYNIKGPIRIGAPLSIDKWLTAINEVVT